MGVLNWLWGHSAPEVVREVERAEPSFEERLVRLTTASRGLAQRSEEERARLIEDVTEALDILDGVISALEAAEVADRAKRTRTRLRTIKTRAQKAAG